MTPCVSANDASCQASKTMEGQLALASECTEASSFFSNVAVKWGVNLWPTASNTLARYIRSDPTVESFHGRWAGL